MIGLEVEIEKRKKGKKQSSDEAFSISFISKLLGVSYMTIKRKLKQNMFWGNEERAIFYSIVPAENRTLEMYEYLFTEQK